MMNIVVDDEILFIHVLGAGTVPTQQNTAAAHIFDMIARHCIFYAM